MNVKWFCKDAVAFFFDWLVYLPALYVIFSSAIINNNMQFIIMRCTHRANYHKLSKTVHFFYGWPCSLSLTYWVNNINVEKYECSSMGEAVKYSTCTYVRCSRKQIRSVCESHAQSVGNLEIKVRPKKKKGGKMEQHMQWQFITAQTVNLMQHVSQLTTSHATRAVTLQYRLVLWKEITPECSLKLTESDSQLYVLVRRLLCKNPKGFTCVSYF